MTRVYVSIGSNIERKKNIRGGVHALQATFGKITPSRVYQTEAEGFVADDFYNLTAAFDTDRPLEEVCAVLTAVEMAHGRTRAAERFSARTLDIDLLLYGELVRHDNRFDIPRSDIRKYAFVLGPLTEIAPDLRDPETGERYAELRQLLINWRSPRAVELNLSDTEQQPGPDKS